MQTKLRNIEGLLVTVKVYCSMSDVLATRNLNQNAPASARSYKIGVVVNHWLIGWLVGNAVFSETAIRIFCMKLGDYKGRKVTETALAIFLVFWPDVSTKYDLQFE